MPLSESELVHGPLYDPVKAHQYYMRTRQLHPRQRGAAQPTGGRAAHQPVRNNPQLQKQRKQAAERVAKLESTLARLQEKLKAKMAQPDTAAEKHKKARESKKYRQEHKQELKTKAKKEAAKTSGGSSGSKSKSDTKKSDGGGSVKELKAAIEKVKSALTAAKARQRALG
jgi:hypothetical protein